MDIKKVYNEQLDYIEKKCNIKFVCKNNKFNF